MNNPNVLTAFDYFTANGFTAAQTCGILGNIQAESNFDPTAIGDGKLAHGICQWHPERYLVIKAATGIDVRTASFADQLKAVLWELNGPEHVAMKLLKATTSAYQAGWAIAEHYERPASKAQYPYRGHLADIWFHVLGGGSTTG